VHGDLLYVCTGNGVNQKHKVSDAPLAPSLIVLNKKTGELVAQDNEKIGTRVLHGQWSSPSLGVVNGKTQLLFGAGDGFCYGFDPTPVSGGAGQVGTLAKLWAFDANGGNKNRYKSEDGPSEIIATPVCWKNHVYVDVGQDWTHGPGKGLLSCIDATLAGDVSKRGKVWSYGQIGRSVSTVSVADGLVYVGDTNGKVHCLDAETGACCWVFDAEAALWNSTLVADGKVYIGNSKGKCFILAAGKQMAQLGSASFGEPMAASFVAANGSLYVATYTHLYAIQSLK
jgi:outer membrane protein assembly factor BamB